MATTDAKKTHEVVFFNNVRYLIILLVVVLHSAGAYNTTTPWWPVRDGSGSPGMDIIYLLLLSFVMPIMFFIAGYFAPKSLDRRGTGGFILSKLRRLGVPFLLGVLFIAPIIIYIAVYTKSVGSGDAPPSYFAYWQTFIADFLSFYTGLMVLGKFNQAHFWFLPQLFLLYAGYAAVAYLRSGASDKTGSKVKPATPVAPSTIVLLIFALVTWGLYSAVNAIISDVNWLLILNLLQSRPASYTLYISYFSLGVYAFRSGWYLNGSIPRFLPAWTAACVLSSVAYLIVGRQYWAASDASVGLTASFTFLRTISCLTYLVVITSAACRWWIRPSPLDRSLSDSSYMIYVVHLLIVLLFQLVLAGTILPLAAKFLVVTGLSIAASFAISHYLVRPRPRLAAVGLLLGNVVLFLVV